MPQSPTDADPAAPKPQQNKNAPVVASNAAHTATRRVIAVITIALFVYYFLGTAAKEAFQYHPIMMAVAFVGFMPETIHAVKAIKRSRSVVDRNAAIGSHMNMAFGMKLFSIAGLVAIVIVKQQYGKFHFTSLHGQIGVLTIMLVVLQVILGIVYHNRSCGSGAFLLKLRKAHYYLGIAVLLGGIVSMGLGMYSHTGQRLVLNPFMHAVLTFATMVLSVWAYLK